MAWSGTPQTCLSADCMPAVLPNPLSSPHHRLTEAREWQSQMRTLLSVGGPGFTLPHPEPKCLVQQGPWARPPLLTHTCQPQPGCLPLPQPAAQFPVCPASSLSKYKLLGAASRPDVPGHTGTSLRRLFWGVCVTVSSGPFLALRLPSPGKASPNTNVHCSAHPPGPLFLCLTAARLCSGSPGRVGISVTTGSPVPSTVPTRCPTSDRRMYEGQESPRLALTPIAVQLGKPRLRER